MDALEFFWLRRRNLPELGEQLLDAPEAVLRASPYGLHSIAWLLWHISRCEDVGINRIVVDRWQVLDGSGWMDRLGVSRRDIGTEMSDAEVGAFSQAVDLSALRGYWRAVCERTTEVVCALRPEDLDVTVSPEHLRRLVADEGVTGASAGWVEEFWNQQPNRGWFLAQLALTHSREHIASARVVRELLNRV